MNRGEHLLRGYDICRSHALFSRNDVGVPTTYSIRTTFTMVDNRKASLLTTRGSIVIDVEPVIPEVYST